MLTTICAHAMSSWACRRGATAARYGAVIGLMLPANIAATVNRNAEQVLCTAPLRL